MIATLLIALMLALPAAPTGKCVLDQAGALTPAEFSAIETQCEAIDRSGAGQIAVVTTNNLEGLTRPQYAERIFKGWGIGHKGKDDGILLLIALPPADRGIKVEIGYGLEGTLPDGKAMAIVRDVGIPQFKAGHLGRGILNIIDGYTPLMRTEAANTALNVKVPTRTPPPATIGAPSHSTTTIKIVVLLGIASLFLLGFIWLTIWLRARRRARDRAAIDAELRAQDQERWNREWTSACKPAAHVDGLTQAYAETPAPAPTRESTTVVAPVTVVVEEQPVYHPPYGASPPRHHKRHSSSDDDSSSSSSSHSPSGDYGSSSSSGSDSGSFGGFSGGSSGGGGGDAGW